MGSVMDAETARGLFERLTERRFSVALGFTYLERMLPAEVWSVQISIGPGTFPGHRLHEAMAVGEEYGCEVHLLGNGLSFLPKAS